VNGSTPSIGRGGFGKGPGYKGINNVTLNVIIVSESRALTSHIQSAKERFGADNGHYHS